MGQILLNNVRGYLAAGITAGATTVTLRSGEGAAFEGGGTLSASNYLIGTLVKVSGHRETAWEIVKITGRSTDTLTITRAQESTTALTFSAGDILDIRFTAGTTFATTADVAGEIHAATATTTLDDADELGLWDSVTSALRKITGASIKTALWTAWGGLIAAGTSKTAPVGADMLAIADSAASNATKSLSFTNLLAYLAGTFARLSAVADVAMNGYKINGMKTGSFNSGKTVTITIASPGVVTWANHGLSANDHVMFRTSGALPTGLSALTIYFVKTVVDTNTFTVSATAGGAVINTSGTQSGTHACYKSAPATTGTVNLNWTRAQVLHMPEPTGTITFTMTDPPGDCTVKLIVWSDGTSTAQTINMNTTDPQKVISYGSAWAATNNKGATLVWYFDGLSYHFQGANQV